jgi:FkbM family methyltransferase
LRYSRLFEVYQWLFKRQVIKQHQKEISFYRSFLPECNLVFDIGANDGHKTAAFLSFAKKVVCCEPDKFNYKILQARFRNKKERVFLENKAVADKEGMAEMLIHHPGSAFNTLSAKWKELLEADNEKKWNEKIQFTGSWMVETTTLDGLITTYGKPDYIKIDVEGYEQWVLSGLSQPVRYLSFETLLPDYVSELNICLEKISTLDKNAVYNIARDEQLLLSEFVSKPELAKWIEGNMNALSIEVIVKMSA